MTEIALIFKHQLPILSICENLQSVDDPQFRFAYFSFLPSVISVSPWLINSPRGSATEN